MVPLFYDFILVASKEEYKKSVKFANVLILSIGLRY